MKVHPDTGIDVVKASTSIPLSLQYHSIQTRFMKKALLIVATIILYLSSVAQEPVDALKFSWFAPGGSARTKAVGGAMGSLGGDITASFVNPAGLAFYKTGDFIFSPHYQFQKTKSNYLGTNADDKTNRFTWGTTGFVVGGGDGRKNVRNVAFSIAMNRTADFNNDVLYHGANNQSSFSQRFVEQLNNSGVKDSKTAEEGFSNGASLFYNTYWIDSVATPSGAIDHFITNAPVASGLLQQYTAKTRGGIYDFALGVAANFQDKLMIGGSIGVPVLNYRRETEFLEADATSNPNNKFDYGIFSENLHTSGVGINMKLGLIYKPAEFWRLGLAVHSPTFYNLTDEYYEDITFNDDVPDNQTLHDHSKSYNHDEPNQSKYALMTPYKVIGSISYVIREIQDVTKQRGFLTADVEYVNYKASSFTLNDENNTSESNKNYYKQLNKAIDNAYKGAFNFRAGGELKFTTVMVRLGAAYYGNPYKDIKGEKGSKLNLSGGLGYRDKGFFVDLTYVHSLNKDVQFAYRLASSPYFGANIKNTTGNVLLTVGFKI
jgi:hypothetical protein